MWTSVFSNLGFLANPVTNFVESVVDNAIRDKITEPPEGSVLYCDLLFGVMEHSGIYIGNNKIIHLNKHGVLEIVSPEEFVSGTTAVSIYVGCIDGIAVGTSQVKNRALNFLKNNRYLDYNAILNNCHIFSSACLTGKLENSCTFLWMLKDECKKNLGVDTWRVWDYKTFGARTDNDCYSPKDLEKINKEINQQDEFVYTTLNKLRLKSEEISKHGKDNPAYTVFGGVFFESKAKAWTEKSQKLDHEYESILTLSEEADQRLLTLQDKRKKIKESLNML